MVHLYIKISNIFHNKKGRLVYLVSQTIPYQSKEFETWRKSSTYDKAILENKCTIWKFKKENQNKPEHMYYWQKKFGKFNTTQ